MVLRGSWDLVSKGISTLVGVISLILITKSHDRLSIYFGPNRLIQGVLYGKVYTICVHTWALRAAPWALNAET